MSAPVALVVRVEVKPESIDTFLKSIEHNAINSRKEPGCLQFDVLRTQDDPNKFIFFEVYESVDAINSHKTQPHYLQYAEFKESGGMVSSVSSRADGLYMTK